MIIKNKTKLLFNPLLIVLSLTATASVQATPIDMQILSGSGWLSTTNTGAGDWTSVGYDDSSWISAYAPYPNSVTTPSDIVEGPTSAELMWYWDQPTAPSGSNGPIEAYFRYEFTLNLMPDSLPLLAQALMIADDNFEFYVNGTLYDFGVDTTLDHNLRPNGQPLPLLADFTSLLVNGDNVLAMYAYDGDGNQPGPHDRGFEYAFFDGVIQTVPEPVSVALLVLGLAGLVAMRRFSGARSRSFFPTVG